jgi:hypothetical protein
MSNAQNMLNAQDMSNAQNKSNAQDDMSNAWKYIGCSRYIFFRASENSQSMSIIYGAGIEHELLVYCTK